MEKLKMCKNGNGPQQHQQHQQHHQPQQHNQHQTTAASCSKSLGAVKKYKQILNLSMRCSSYLCVIHIHIDAVTDA